MKHIVHIIEIILIGAIVIGGLAIIFPDNVEKLWNYIVTLIGG